MAKRREITLKLVYVGSPPTKRAASENLEYVFFNEQYAEPGQRSLLVLKEGPEMAQEFRFVPNTEGESSGAKVWLHVTAVPSGDAYKKSRAKFVKGADGIVFVADADPSSADANRAALAELTKALEAPRKHPLVIQITGSKQRGTLKAAEIIEQLGVDGCTAVAASPEDGTGVVETLIAIERAATSARDARGKR